MISINLIAGGVPQRPITGYQVFCKTAPSGPAFPLESRPLSPALTERLLGKSPLRLVAERSQIEKHVWREVLECGHVTHAFVDFFWDERGHLIYLEPTTKRRRCHACKAAADAAILSPKKPSASAGQRKTEVA